jgi:hypothetical protein
MEKYNFLVKPVFYIFSLVFSCWMVFSIEKISPSDFGKYKSLFEVSYDKNKKAGDSDQWKLSKLKALYKTYKEGAIDSSTFFRQLDKIATEEELANETRKKNIVQK